jgi:hypothetical protein
LEKAACGRPFFIDLFVAFEFSDDRSRSKKNRHTRTLQRRLVSRHRHRDAFRNTGTDDGVRTTLAEERSLWVRPAAMFNEVLENGTPRFQPL